MTKQYVETPEDFDRFVEELRGDLRTVRYLWQIFCKVQYVLLTYQKGDLGHARVVEPS